MAHTRVAKAAVVERKWGSKKFSGTLGVEGSSACWRSSTHLRHCRSSLVPNTHCALPPGHTASATLHQTPIRDLRLHRLNSVLDTHFDNTPAPWNLIALDRLTHNRSTVRTIRAESSQGGRFIRASRWSSYLPPSHAMEHTLAALQCVSEMISLVLKHENRVWNTIPCS